MREPDAASERPVPPHGPAPGPRRRAQRWQWLTVALAAVAVFAAVTWPFVVQLNGLWTVRDHASIPGGTSFLVPEDAFTTGDHMQNIFIDSVVIENVLSFREPYLDLREGAAGPEPLRTTSMNLPWTPVIALLWPLVGLVPAYNLTLPMATVLTALTAFGYLRRHTRWWLLAAAGGLLYAFSTHRMYQLTVHFNAVMTWVFPAVIWAWEVALERFRAGRPWGRPAAALAGMIVLVGVSGEYHLILYLAGLVAFLIGWALVGALLRREPPPWLLSAAAAGSVAAACGYVLAAFSHVFGGEVAGDNGSWEQVLLYAPYSILALVRKDFGESGEGMIYVGWVVLGLAALGLGVTVARRLRPVLPYAVLLLPLLLLTYGPTASVGAFQPYRWAFEHFPFLSLQRVPERMMVLTGLMLLLLAVTAVEQLVRLEGRGVRSLAVATLVLVTAVVLVDYQVSYNVISPSHDDNAVVERLEADGDEAGPIAGLPVVGKTTTWNAGTTYVAALSRRHTLNAYNQTPAPWLDERLEALAPLNRGKVVKDALDVLRETGTRQVLVIDEPRVFGPGQWREVITALERSERFRVVVEDAPFALLEFRG